MGFLDVLEICLRSAFRRRPLAALGGSDTPRWSILGGAIRLAYEWSVGRTMTSRLAHS